MGPRILGPIVPDADHVLAGVPFLILRKTQPDDGAALRANQILAGDADRPAETSRLCDDLVERVHGVRAADPRDRFHVFAALEKLHTKRDRPQPQQVLEIGCELPPIHLHIATPR
jgi:hypothetical protein